MNHLSFRTGHETKAFKELRSHIHIKRSGFSAINPPSYFGTVKFSIEFINYSVDCYCFVEMRIFDKAFRNRKEHYVRFFGNKVAIRITNRELLYNCALVKRS